ncbi:hypothetical protein [Methylocaldum gracile]|jgi:hypothetical protein|uniref:hypothetical protein n=1 Tax=Methylocaldum sp. 0917 TaxID=2485163 RepID=UPI001062160A
MRGNYSLGTVSVENDSDIVTGLGVLWLGTLQPGDQFQIAGESDYYLVASVDDFNQLTLTSNYTGSTASGLGYTAGPSVVQLSDPSYTVNKISIDADGTDYVSIAGLPNPSYVTVEVPENQGIPEQPVTTVTDGEFRMTTTVAGQYKITVHAHDYNDFEVIVDAGAA